MHAARGSKCQSKRLAIIQSYHIPAIAFATVLNPLDFRAARLGQPRQPLELPHHTTPVGLVLTEHNIAARNAQHPKITHAGQALIDRVRHRPSERGPPRPGPEVERAERPRQAVQDAPKLPLKHDSGELEDKGTESGHLRSLVDERAEVAVGASGQGEELELGRELVQA